MWEDGRIRKYGESESCDFVILRSRDLASANRESKVPNQSRYCATRSTIRVPLSSFRSFPEETITDAWPLFEPTLLSSIPLSPITPVLLEESSPFSLPVVPEVEFTGPAAGFIPPGLPATPPAGFPIVPAIAPLLRPAIGAGLAPGAPAPAILSSPSCVGELRGGAASAWILA